MKDLFFESLNPEEYENEEGVRVYSSSQTTDHACGKHGCQFTAGVLINNKL